MTFCIMKAIVIYKILLFGAIICHGTGRIKFDTSYHDPPTSCPGTSCSDYESCLAVVAS